MNDALTEIASKLAPEVLSELVHLARLALAGAPKSEIVLHAERMAMLAAYKRALRAP